ncbi:hypothetical protein [Qaidamihabitans albus]|uniref:hypothetical protein n=1 Tax=Qaidamihabitans albus TaxID=2795733 RepID=UPI0018F1EE24|nr:hypothetical protein [Qaidamihabitans albus]
MKRVFATGLLSLSLLIVGCTTDVGRSTSATTTQRPTSSPATTEKTTERPSTTATTPEPAAAETAVASEPKRPTPTAGYQCIEGDEDIYEVCAAHEAWVAGQVEFAECTNSGGDWNIPLQECTYPPRTEAPSKDDVHSSDPEFRDANGETYEEYCARTGQTLDNCAAG